MALSDLYPTDLTALLKKLEHQLRREQSVRKFLEFLQNPFFKSFGSLVLNNLHLELPSDQENKLASHLSDCGFLGIEESKPVYRRPLL